MSKTAVAKRHYKPIVELDRGSAAPSSFCVLVSHSELDNLVGRLMQMCDLIGDVEQRAALKDTIKQISRDWLDNLYADSGYEKYFGLAEGVIAHKIKQ